MPEEMYLVPAELMRCFNSIGRLQKLRADVTRDLRILEREVQRLLAESPGNAQIEESDEIRDLQKLWELEPATVARGQRRRKRERR